MAGSPGFGVVVPVSVDPGSRVLEAHPTGAAAVLPLSNHYNCAYAPRPDAPPVRALQ